MNSSRKDIMTCYDFNEYVYEKYRFENLYLDCNGNRIKHLYVGGYVKYNLNNFIIYCYSDGLVRLFAGRELVFEGAYTGVS